MKKRDKSFIALITTIAMTITMFISGTSIKTNAKEISEEEIKSDLQEKFDEYLKEKSEALENNQGDTKKDTENEEKKLDPEEEIKIMVQLQDEAAIESQDETYTDDVKDEENEIKDNQESVISEVESITGNKVDKTFGYLVNGFSIKSKRKYIDEIKSVDKVKSVKEINSYKPSMFSADKITKAINTWKEHDYKGHGMVISIIDSGVDPTHKDLQNIDTSKTKLKKEDVDEKINNEVKHGQFFSDKVPYGYNYADNNTEVRDLSGVMHGMHVAGIAGANGSDEEVENLKAIKGVAPEA